MRASRAPSARARVRSSRLRAVELRCARPERALVEVKAGLLAEGERDLVAQASLGEAEALDRHVAAHHAGTRLEALELGDRGRGAVDDRARHERRDERVEDDA